MDGHTEGLPGGRIGYAGDMSGTRQPPSAAAVSPDLLDCDLGWTLGVVFRSYVRIVDALVGHLPGGARGYQVLAATAQDLPGGQGALAQRLGIDKTVMTYLVDDLEKAGLVERRPDPADRRNKRIVATTAGVAVRADVRARLQQAEDHLLGPLDPAERPVFRELLQKLTGRAHSLAVDDTCELVAELDAGATPTRPPDSARPGHAARPRPSARPPHSARR